MKEHQKPDPRPKTRDEWYADRLAKLQLAAWKNALGVQAPYRWNLRRLKPGFTLEIGCGLGRNLKHLDGHGIGVDHNPDMVHVARSRGLEAFTPIEFRGTSYFESNRFDSLLFSHVLEHMTEEEARSLVLTYVPLLKTNGQVIFMTPQERGYRSDPTHVQFVDFGTLRSIARGAGLTVVREFSFPLPRLFGTLFKYNEFVLVSRHLIPS